MLWLVPVPNAWRWGGCWTRQSKLAPCSLSLYSCSLLPLQTGMQGLAQRRHIQHREGPGAPGTGSSPSVLGALALLWNCLQWRRWGKSHKVLRIELLWHIRSYAVSSCPILSQITACGTARPQEKVWIWWGQAKDRGKPPQMSPCSWPLQVMGSGWRLQFLVYLGCKAWRAGPPAVLTPLLLSSRLQGWSHIPSKGVWKAP